MRNFYAHVSGTFILLTVIILNVSSVSALSLTQINLVSDIPGLAALTDANLRNPWGVSFNATSPLWTSNQVTSTANLFTIKAVTVSQNSLEVTIPTTASGAQGPTGQVSNNTTAFLVNGTPANFIFANLNGTISAWNNSAVTTAQIKATTPGAVYTGLAIANPASGPFLYAANGAQNRVDVFNGAFTDVTSTVFAGKFVDPNLPAGFVPFNVQNIGGKIYVTYAPAGRPAQTAATEGQGFVNVFDTSGNLLQRLISDSKLASPWGITMAPAGFDGFGGDLLVGNFSYVAGEINAYDPVTGAFIGTVLSNNNFQGLWALAFGNGGNGGDPNILYFTTGLNAETHGLLAALAAIPEPNALLLFALGGLALWSFKQKPCTARERNV